MKIKRFEPKLPLGKIYIDKENVRSESNAKFNLEELEQSIKEVGVLQPIMVVEHNGKFKVIVGQRRFLASKNIRNKTISAVIIDVKDMNEAKILSLSENIHRQRLPYKDIFEACMYLSKKLKGTETQKIREISKKLGLSEVTIKGYLADKIIPESVRVLISERKISKKRARDIVAAYYPNQEKIIKLTFEVILRLTGYDAKAAIDIAKKDPSLPVENVVKRAKEKRIVKKLTIYLDSSSWESLKIVAKEKEMEPSEYVEELIKGYFEGKGYERG